ncbi:MAG: hypothetical protein HUJ75_07515 [Parasporobacterium sp.]|nr:hypothetical protein [Parasporobacterium sp.]
MGVKLERIVKPYYDNLEEGKITARRCKECGAVEWPPLLGCNTCGSTEMEWIEISGKAQMLQFVMSSPITRRPEMEDIKPYVLAVVQIEEGPAVNAMVRGINKKNKEFFREHLPYPVHATIIKREGYSTVIFDVDEVQE